VLLTCLLFAGYTALSVAVLPPGIWTTWLHDIMPQGGYANNAISASAPWNQNINAFISRLFLPNDFSETPLALPGLAKPAAAFLALAVLGSTCFYSFRQSRRRTAKYFSTEEIACYLLTIFLIAPLSWDHHLVFVLPAAVLAIELLVTRQLSRGEVAVALGAVFLMAWPLPYEHEALKRGWLTLFISMKFFAAVALWFFFLNRLRLASCPIRDARREAAASGESMRSRSLPTPQLQTR
jgi:hypothetical protein